MLPNTTLGALTVPFALPMRTRLCSLPRPWTGMSLYLSVSCWPMILACRACCSSSAPDGWAFLGNVPPFSPPAGDIPASAEEARMQRRTRRCGGIRARLLGIQIAPTLQAQRSLLSRQGDLHGGGRSWFSLRKHRTFKRPSNAAHVPLWSWRGNIESVQFLLTLRNPTFRPFAFFTGLWFYIIFYLIW